MLESLSNLTDIGRAIQLSLAPVFLLTGIAGILNVMMVRLARIIDRGRFLAESRLPPDLFTPQMLDEERENLERRRQLASVAITAGTLSALLVCMVIAGLFIEALLGLRLKWLVGLLFTASTIALIVGLAYFLREVHLASATVRILMPPAGRQ